jgi:hypothetical protein
MWWCRRPAWCCLAFGGRARLPGPGGGRRDVGMGRGGGAGWDGGRGDGPAVVVAVAAIRRCFASCHKSSNVRSGNTPMRFAASLPYRLPNRGPDISAGFWTRPRAGSVYSRSPAEGLWCAGERGVQAGRRSAGAPRETSSRQGASSPSLPTPATSNTAGQRPDHPAASPPRQGPPERLHRASARRTGPGDRRPMT